MNDAQRFSASVSPTILVPGVRYQVTGEPRLSLFAEDGRVLYLGKTTSVVSRGETETVLHFAAPSGRVLEVTAETVEGLSPVIPPLTKPFSTGQQRLVQALFTQDPDGRVAAVLSLSENFSEEVFWLVWQIAEHDDERTFRFDQARSVRDGLVRKLSGTIPQGVALVETALRAGRGLSQTVARAFLAHGHSLYFEPALREDLQSPQAEARRLAIEELELIGRFEGRALLATVLDDPNPSVALKAQYVLARLPRAPS